MLPCVDAVLYARISLDRAGTRRALSICASTAGASEGVQLDRETAGCVRVGVKCGVVVGAALRMHARRGPGLDQGYE